MLSIPDTDPIVFDLGTGLRFWGLEHTRDDPGAEFRATALVSHLHWDHVQGLPFLTPLHSNRGALHIIGPPQVGETLEEAFEQFICPPYFPVPLAELAGTVTFAEATGEPVQIGRATVTTCPVPHVGPTIGFRVEFEGRSVAYVSDHQQPAIGSTSIDEAVLALCEGVDLLIHDSQYTPSEFASRTTWGHCTTEYALEVAIQSGARSLALFHHDPAHDDGTVEELTRATAELAAARRGPQVFAASEGLAVDL